MAITASFFFNYFEAQKNQKSLALLAAESFFQQIIITRQWNANHGGLYAPVTEKNQPNHYLKTKKRDLQFDSGLTLTKINPALMTRQISEVAQHSKGIHFHITSLNPIRPENSATDIETDYLHQFELNTEGKGEFVSSDEGSSYFYMAPLTVEKSCLDCHAEQGYKEGDIRGGISVTLPFKKEDAFFTLLISHVSIGLLGLIGLTFVARKLNASYSTIKNQAVIDALTGIPNRRSFAENILQAFYCSRRDNTPLSVLLCDIDNFKKYNDTYGHNAGDECLREVAHKIQSSLNRPSDFCARYGGEEFVVILTDTKISGATLVANRIRSAIEGMQIAHVGSPPANVVTISMGGVTLCASSLSSYEEFIQYADEALYSAKDAGRNRVKFHKMND